MSRAILFGYEGGLVDPAGSRFRALEAVLGEEGIELSSELLAECPFRAPHEEWLAAVVARTRGAGAAALAPRLLVRAAARRRAELKESGPAWLTGAIDFVRSAAAALDLGVLTELSRGEVTRALDVAGLRQLVKVVVGAEDLERRGARAWAYLLALNRLNTRAPLPARLIHPHEVVAIEGTAEGVKAAASAGLVTVAIGLAAAEAPAADLRVDGYASLDVARLASG